MSKNKPTKPIAKKTAKKPNGRKSWMKVAKKVHELNKKKDLGFTWAESMRFASKKVYPKFKGQAHNRIKLTDIESEFDIAFSEDVQPTPQPMPTPKEKCFSALDVLTEDLIDRAWWEIGDDDVWMNFDPNLPMRFAFDGITDTGIIMKSNMPNMVDIREDIRRQRGKDANNSDGETTIVFRVLIQPNKQDDKKPCSYYVLVTLIGSNYDMGVNESDEVFGQKSEEDLTEEELQKRISNKSKEDKIKKAKRTKTEAKKTNRPKEVEPKSVTKSKVTSTSTEELEKIKLQKSSRESLERILDGLRQDFKDGILSKRQYLQRQKLIIDKFERGGKID
jgi:hypothetical protein